MTGAWDTPRPHRRRHPQLSASPQLYRPRAAEHTVLHRIVRTHLETFHLGLPTEIPAPAPARPPPGPDSPLVFDFLA